MIADFYGRKSNSDGGRSVASQEEEFRADCTDEGLQVGRIFADPDRSASRFARKPRPDYHVLLEHIRSGTCQMLSLWECSRGSRKLADWVNLIDLCRDSDVLIRIVSHSRTYDLRQWRDYRTLVDEGVDAHGESERTSLRIRRGKRSAARDGRPAGRLPFGFAREYDPHTRKLVRQYPHPDEAPVVRDVVRRVAGGASLAELARELNERGVPTPEGTRWSAKWVMRVPDGYPVAAEIAQRLDAGEAPRAIAVDLNGRGEPVVPPKSWTDKQVRLVVLNASYVGQRVHQGVVVGDASWDPLVDPGLWRTACARLTDPARRTSRGSRLTHWLSSAVACGRCGEGFLRSATRHCRGTVARAYRCTNCLRCSAAAEALERAVERAILRRLRCEDSAPLFQQRRDDQAVAGARAEEEMLRARLDAHYGEAAEGRLSARGLAAVEAKLLPQIDAAVEKARRLSLPPTLAGFEDVDVAGRWGELGAGVRREVVRAMAVLVLGPGPSQGRRFDVGRLAGSRWVGEERTWGESALDPVNAALAG